MWHLQSCNRRQQACDGIIDLCSRELRLSSLDLLGFNEKGLRLEEPVQQVRRRESYGFGSLVELSKCRCEPPVGVVGTINKH